MVGELRQSLAHRAVYFYGMKIVPAGTLLMVEGRPMHVLWLAPEGGMLVWPRRAVNGYLHGMPRTVAAARIWPRDAPAEGILVSAPLVPIREGMAVRLGPKGFELKTLIVANADGSWSPSPVWVGDELTLVETHCPECGGDLGGTEIGRLESHTPGCPRFPL